MIYRASGQRSNSCASPARVIIGSAKAVAPWLVVHEIAAEMDSPVDGSDVLALLPSYGDSKVFGSDAAAVFSARQGRRTCLLLCMVGFIEGADMQLLPATFRALEADLGLSPTNLGQMSLAQSLFMALSAPIWGALADRGSRKSLLVWSCLAWGVFTTLLALSDSMEQMLVLRALHGTTLASLGPIAQSLVADVTESSRRGAAFGRVYFATALGMILASQIGTSFAEETLAFSIRGWRLVFSFVAALSVVTAVVIRFAMEEPPRASLSGSAEAFPEVASTCSGTMREELRRAQTLARIPTFNVIVLQGIFGTVPWNAMGFMTMYLQYCGHSDSAAAMVVSGLLFGRALGGIAGGLLGDALARRCPAHGRPLTAELSVLMGIPLVATLVSTAGELEARALAAIAFSLGFVASWCSAGANLPMLAEVVDPSRRASVVAWLAALSGSSGALFGAPVVGLLSERVFGYQSLTAADSMEHAAAVKERNMLALKYSMLWGTVPPWLICALLFSMLHWTYGADVKRAQGEYARVAAL